MRSTRQVVASLAATAFFLAVLLVCAGRLNYWQAWAYAAISLLMNLATQMILRKDPDLVRERRKPGAGAKGWDKVLLGLGLLLTLAMLVIAGLESGRHEPQLSWMWSIAGVVLSLAGMSIFLLALRENRFFSAVVRIQTDRGQTVCTTGPYSVVRHPGNAGMIIGTMGLPFVLMSVWAMVPAVLSVVLLVTRTHLEDLLLQNELEGYREYKQKTRFLLMPGIW
jgi:protein-S-isoprenylcysteine O-methyltransferase Ste14